jgi:hypothetical protein
MKQIRIANALLAIMVLLTSCTKTVYSHKDFMEQFRTKDQVVRQFGVPYKKGEDGDYTEYVYDFGHTVVGMGYKNSNTNASVTDDGNSIYGRSNTNGYGGVRYDELNRHVRFVFDNRNNVVSYETQGVDFSKKKTAVGRTILLFTLSIGAGIALAFLTSSTD